jgi:hypothetical protein
MQINKEQYIYGLNGVIKKTGVPSNGQAMIVGGSLGSIKKSDI